MGRKTGRRVNKEAKRLWVLENYGKEAAESFDPVTSLATIDGQQCYIVDPTKPISMKHAMLSDLSACGMSTAQITRQLSKNGNAHSAHNGNVLKDPRIRARTEEAQVDMVAGAKETIHSCLGTAAQNVKDAVIKGDLKTSKLVLEIHGIQPQKQVQEVHNFSFGAWLSDNGTDITEVSEIKDKAHKIIDVTNDVKQLPDSRKGGVRLDEESEE